MFLWFLITWTISYVLSMLIACLFVFSSLGHHPRLYLSLSVSSFHFLSIGLHPRLNLSFFSLHVVSHHCDTILFYLSFFFLHLLLRVSEHWDTILGSILVYYFRYNLEWCPYGDKSMKLRIKLDKTWKGVPMMRNQG